ncbi:major pollen allergen Ole e 1-like [Cucurbita pepo subsp. pepo]|uniref:major pollen allergen Ole e 1-like n=1 Tax=Cucurbita pepo subsp. pepo TaxID=3664 RepID=UPI000C9D7CE1|nr:major pollen allergen Ole e 1-like [Cucurbita pepo subsp. pepo]
MVWFLFVLVLFLNHGVDGFSEPLQKKALPPPPAVLVGSVFCDTCYQQNLSKFAHFIPGATVAVECRDEKASKTSFQHQVKTNKHGKFRVVLPFSVAKHMKKIESCNVRLIKSSEPFCSVASSATSSALKLKNSKNKNGVRIFSAGFFTFKPAFCNQKTDIFKSKQVNNPQLLFPPIVPPNPLQPEETSSELKQSP